MKHFTKVVVHTTDGQMKKYLFKRNDRIADDIRDTIGWNRVARIEIFNTTSDERHLLAVLS